MNSVLVDAIVQSTRPQKRRLLPILDDGVQWKYSLWVGAIVASVFVGMGSLLYQLQMTQTSLLSVGLDPAIRAKILRSDHMFLGGGIIVASLILMGVVWACILATHRMSGPVLVMMRHLQVLGEGRYPEVRSLRKNDEWLDVMNTFSETIRAMRVRDQKNIERLLALRADVLKEYEQTGSSTLAKVVLALEEELLSLRERAGSDFG